MHAMRRPDGYAHWVARLLALAAAFMTAGAPLGGVVLAQTAAGIQTDPSRTTVEARSPSEGTEGSEEAGREPVDDRDATGALEAEPARQAAPPQAADGRSAAAPVSQPWYTAQELEYLARLVHAEAEGEPYAGRVGVAAVVLNRVRHRQFPDTIAGVIFQPGAFEPVANGRIWEEPDSLSWQAAKAALDGWDPTGGAIFFYNPAKVGRSSWIWQVRVTGQIGEHVFGWR